MASATVEAQRNSKSTFGPFLELGLNGLIVDASEVKGAPELTITSSDGVNITLGAKDGTLFAGDSATAEALSTPREINGVEFDGTADITVPAFAPTVAFEDLPAATPAGQQLFVSDAAGASLTGSLCFSNGTIWVDVTTGAEVVTA